MFILNSFRQLLEFCLHKGLRAVLEFQGSHCSGPKKFWSLRCWEREGSKVFFSPPLLASSSFIGDIWVQDRPGLHQHRSWKGEGTKIQRGQSLRSELTHPQEAARQASRQWSKGVTSSDWARLFGYLSSGRSPDDNTQNQAWFQVICSVTAGPPPEAEKGGGNHIVLPKGRGQQEFGTASGWAKETGIHARI